MTDTTEVAETHDGHHEPTTSILTPYHGTPVVAAGIAIANASGGLHEAVAVDPVELEIGSTVHVVLRCVVRPPQYDPVDKDNLRGPLKLVNRLRAEDATFVDEALVQDHLAEQRERIEHAKSIEERRKREEAGELELDFGDGSSNGEPQKVSEVLDDVIGLNEGIEAEQRGERMAELHRWEKDDLVDHLEKLGCEFDPDSMQKADLVAEIVQWEEAASA